MELIYASAGRDQAPWVVEVLERGLPLKDGADCARLGIRRQPGRTEADESRLCLDASTRSTRGMRPRASGSLSVLSVRTCNSRCRGRTATRCGTKPVRWRGSHRRAPDRGRCHNGDYDGFVGPAEAPASRTLCDRSRHGDRRRLRGARCSRAGRLAHRTGVRTASDSLRSAHHDHRRAYPVLQ